jgi:phosphoglycerate kinase
MTFKRIQDAPINRGDKVFVRIDCNVPLNSDGSIADTFRLEAVMPTIELLRGKGARIIIAGAIGRPQGKRDESLTTKCIADYYSAHGIDSTYVAACVGSEVDQAIEQCQAGSAIVLENLRFDSREENNDEGFAKDLASLADIYVDDAFGQCHRNQASIVAIASILPSYAGICLQKEVDALEKVLSSKEHPVVAVLGGAKVSDKLGVIEALLDKCDHIVIGGAMAYTFLKGQGVAIGNSLCEDEYVAKSQNWFATGKIKLPVDWVVAKTIDSADTQTVDHIDDNLEAFDIGPASVKDFAEYLSTAKTILWNGPMGVFEKEQFAQGTKAIAETIADAQAFTLIGGGDSVAAIRAYSMADRYDHVSTGGGATLEYIEQGSLVGIDALSNAES